MKRFKTSHIIGIILITFALITVSSCASTNVSRVENKKRGLMLMDKSEYTMNKGRWKGTKDYKVKKKHRKNKHHKVYRK